jgi:tRNA-2-methylthio-N6-dimethylallyladenosine synthase
MEKLWIKTFGCLQNVADSEKIKAYFQQKGCLEVEDWKMADLIVINTCVIRESAENRAFGLINEINKYRRVEPNFHGRVILTGCLVNINKKKTIEGVEKICPVEKISLKLDPLRDKRAPALITISNGCNNYCSYCIVPQSRGREKSRPFEEIIEEAKKALVKGFNEVVLIGQNVNSYGADLSLEKSYVSMGKRRLKSSFPTLLEEIAKMPFKKVSFISSNPWDFSDQLIEVIAKHNNIDRLIHLPLQSGDDKILQKMNRGYTAKEYMSLVKKIRAMVERVKFSTDIIIGFPGENETAFSNTVKVCQEVGFEIAYLNKYSPRPGTVSAQLYPNDVPQTEKRRRWQILDRLVNQKLP